MIPHYVLFGISKIDNESSTVLKIKLQECFHLWSSRRKKLRGTEK